MCIMQTSPHLGKVVKRKKTPSLNIPGTKNTNDDNTHTDIKTVSDLQR